MTQPIVTPRLRKLEALEAEASEMPKHEDFKKGGTVAQLDYVTLKAHVRGYRMALADLAPVLEAAWEVIHSRGNEADVHALEGALAAALEAG